MLLKRNTQYEQLKLDFENPESEWYIKEPDAQYGALNDKDEYRAESTYAGSATHGSEH